jgi:membrane protein
MNRHPSRLNKFAVIVKAAIGPQRSGKAPLLPALAAKYAKLLQLSWRGFKSDLCPLRASALTLYTLLSIVPVFAMLFGIAKGFGIDALLRERLLEQFREQREIAFKLIDFAQSLLARTQGELVAGIGIALLFWSVMSVIGEIEHSFNHIWKVEKSRAFARKVSDYLSLLLLAPVLLTASSSIAVYAQSRISGLMTAADLPEYGSALLHSLFGYLPLLLVWLLFFITFVFMPNTRVAVKSGVIAGVLTGTAYQLTQWAYLRLQIGMSSYNAIYGSFAALPLFIVWLQSGWLILLFGAELAFYHQHYETYRVENEASAKSFALKKIAALRIAHLLVQKFAAAEPPLTADEIARSLHLPLPDVRDIVAELLATRILAQVQSDAAEAAAYQPARDIGLLHIATITEALENGGVAISKSETPDRFREITAQFAATIRNSPENRLLKDV